MKVFTIPGGDDKGVALDQAAEKSLQYWEKRISDDLEAGKSRYPDRDRPLLDAMRAELRRRAGGGSAAPAPSAAIVQHVDAKLVGQTYRDPERVNAVLAQLAAESNLITPATVVGSLQVGCGVAFSLVRVDEADCFEVDGGKLSVSAHVCHQVASALGASFDAPQRLDDASDPHYARYSIFAVYKDFTGQWLRRPGEYELDLRDGSERVQEQLDKVEQAPPEKRAEVAAKAKKAIRQMRKFIVQRAVTGAQTCAIAKTGFKRSYTRGELKRSFVVARLVFDGHTADPQLAAVFATEVARAHLGGMGALYGQPMGAPLHALPSAPAGAGVLPPPSVVDAQAEDGELDARDEPVREPVLLPDRDETPVSEADTALLQRWRRRTQEDLDDGPPPEEVPAMRALLDAIEGELAQRAVEKY